MSSGVEFEGSNVETAVDNACKELNIPKKELKYDVISYGSSGIFGLVGTKKARIRVIVSPPKETVSDHEEIENVEIPSLPIQEKDTPPILTTAPEGETRDAVTFPDSSIELGKQVLQRIVDAITTDARIVAEEEDPERLSYKVDGGNAAILIGKRGQTLEAIQYLVEKVINKHNNQRVRVQVDIEGYLEMRHDSLKRLAERLAEKAKQTGKPVTIGQMNAHDRRIVHMTLKDNYGVRTKSVGDGFLRKLVIFPKKNVTQGSSSQ